MGADLVREKIRRVRKSIPLRHRLAIKEFFRPLEGLLAFKKSDRHVARAVRRLALGFDHQPLRDLEALARGIGRFRRRKALIELLQFHSASLTAFGRNEIVRLNREFPAARSLQPDEAVVRSHSLRLVGQHDVAKEILDRVKTRTSPNAVLLARINLEGSLEKKLELLSSGFSKQKLASFIVQALDETMSFPSAVAFQDFKVRKRQSGPKVSVFVASHNNATTIDMAVRGVLAQSWANLECIVVDRASSDETILELERLSQQDSRVKVIFLHEDPGHFGALNKALEVCTGSFITVQSAHGWSHPNRIEHQVSSLVNSASVSSMVEAIELSERGEILLTTSKFSFSDLSSLMLRKELFCSEFGRWDNVELGADSELVMRVQARFGSEAIKSANAVFCLHIKQKAPAFRSGDVANYLALARAHHACALTLNYSQTSGWRSFAAPASLVREQAANSTNKYDVIIASDFRMHGGSTLSSVEEIKAQWGAGLKTAIIQLHRYDLNPEKEFNPKIVALLNQGAADLLSSVDRVSCDLLLVRYPPVLQHHQNCAPHVSAEKMRVIINQPPMSDYSENSVVRYTIPECLDNATRYFGTAGKWHPIGPLVRDALHKHHAEWLSIFDLSPDDWPNIVDLAEFRPNRERQISNPVIIGRHSRDHIMKWPGSAKTLLMIYPDRNDIRVAVLGGAKTPTSLIGYTPKGWTVHDFDSVKPSEFLKTIDVFVYFTHDAWVESFGRVIIEAMAAALPTVLPPIYRPLFGDGAIYAEPHNVGSVIQRLVDDPQYYRESSLNALSYVERRFGHEMHVSRVGEAKLPRIQNAVAES